MAGKILIVDDEEAVRRLIAEVLSDSYECFDAPSAEAALTALADGGYQAIVSDINMSGMSGLELLSRTSEISPDTSVILVTGDSTLDTAVSAVRGGAFDYITKPFDICQIEAAVARAVEVSDLRATKRAYERDLERIVVERTAQLQFNATHDLLTGLPNRGLLLDRLEVCLRRMGGDVAGAALILFDLDRFKLVNGTHGHDAGDGVLREAAARLLAEARPGDTVARTGGDEFAVLLDPAPSPSAAVALFEKVRSALARPFSLPDGTRLCLTATAGVSYACAGGRAAADMMCEADTAIHRAKERGSSRVEIFDAAMSQRASEFLTLEADLREALGRAGGLVPYFQPIVCVEDGRLKGFEALARWNHSERGLVGPDRFIPVAEETGLIVQLDRLILETACARLAEWIADGADPDLFVSVNLSAGNFDDPGLAGRVLATLTAGGLAPTNLKLEITETVLLTRSEQVRRTIEELRAAGVMFAADDFGTGYSSLGYLHRHPLDVLKIDRSFTRDLRTSRSDRGIVNAVISLARDLDMEVVAEGVETADDHDLLKEMGCGYAQGYLYAKPLPAEEAGRLTLRRVRAA